MQQQQGNSPYYVQQGTPYGAPPVPERPKYSSEESGLLSPQQQQQATPAYYGSTTTRADNGTSCNIPPWLVCFIAYFFLLLGGLIVGLTERRSFYCCYHGWQSVMLGLAFIPGWVGAVIADIILDAVFGVAFVVLLWAGFVCVVNILCLVIAIIRAPNGALFQLPLLGHFAEKIACRYFH